VTWLLSFWLWTLSFSGLQARIKICLHPERNWTIPNFCSLCLDSDVPYNTDEKIYHYFCYIATLRTYLFHFQFLYSVVSSPDVIYTVWDLKQNQLRTTGPKHTKEEKETGSTNGGSSNHEHIFGLPLQNKLCAHILERKRARSFVNGVCVCVCVCVCARTHTHSRHPALKAKPPGRGLWRARMRHAQSVPLFKPLSEAYLLPQRCLHRPLHQLVGCELALCSGIFLLVSVMCRWKLFWKLSLLSLLIILFSLYHYSIHTFSSWFVLTTSFCIVSSWRIYLWFSSAFQGLVT